MADRVNESKTLFENVVRHDLRARHIHFVNREGREVGDTLRHRVPKNVVMQYLNGAILNFKTLSDADFNAQVDATAKRLLSQLIGERTGEVFVVQGEPVDLYENGGHLYFAWRVGCIAEHENQQR